MELLFSPPSHSRYGFEIPASCPFSITKVHFGHKTTSSTWLIREHDSYGEYPHIYAKLCQAPKSSEKDVSAQVIVLSDTGCATEVRNPDVDRFHTARKQPRSWNICTFLEYTINPGGRIPYLVITTHCHYDHILGIGKLPPTSHEEAGTTCNHHLPTQVLSSAKGELFVTPYSNLQKHSLCTTLGLSAPRYSVSTWAHDFMKVIYQPKSSPKDDNTTTTTSSIPTNITIIHTPGHTPDSLTWYDTDLHLLCVGDSFYAKQSTQPQLAPWGPEPLMPTIFDLGGSNLAAWWGSMGKILGFVREKNQELEDESEVSKDRDIEIDDGDDGFVLIRTPNPKAPCPIETTFQPCRHTDPWVVVDDDHKQKYPTRTRTQPSAPPRRVHLCAAHTTLNLDAERAILKMRDFMAGVLRDDIPSTRVEDGPRGEERWLWDWALEDTDTERMMRDKRKKGGGKEDEFEFSVLAPLSVVQEGRKKIPKSQWEQ